MNSLILVHELKFLDVTKFHKLINLCNNLQYNQKHTFSLRYNDKILIQYSFVCDV